MTDPNTTVARERLTVRQNASALADASGIIVSALETNSSAATIIVGSPGLPNVEQELHVGGAVLFETLMGVFEVRVMATNVLTVEVLVTRISPRPGVLGAFVDEDVANTRFAEPEITRIEISISLIKAEMSERDDLRPEQLDYISRKLDELAAASRRLGRKDWQMFALATMTNIVATVSLSEPVAKALFKAATVALSWLIQGGMWLLPR